MPLYEYRCPDCETQFERLVRGSDTAPTITCPTCGGEKSARVLSMFATSGARATSASSAASAAACGPVG